MYFLEGWSNATKRWYSADWAPSFYFYEDARQALENDKSLLQTFRNAGKAKVRIVYRTQRPIGPEVYLKDVLPHRDEEEES